MRVLIVGLEYPPLGGGAAKATRAVAKELSRAIHVDLLVGMADDVPPESVYQDTTKDGQLRVHPIPISKQNPHYWTVGEIGQFLVQGTVGLSRLWRNRDYDVVHSFLGFPAGLLVAGQLLGPHVISLLGSDVPGFSSRVDRLGFVMHPMFRGTWNQASTLVANGSRLRELAEEFTPNRSVRLIPGGVDLKRFHPPDREQSIGQQPVTFLFVGRLVRRKNVEVLCRSFAELCRTFDEGSVCTLDLVGEGPLRDDLRQLIRELGVDDRIHIRGAVDPEEMPEIYRQADVFVLPSGEEGMSNALLEAIATGLPVVVSETAGVDLVEGNGIKVSMNHSKPGCGELTNALRRMVEHGEERKQMGEKSRQLAGEYSWESVARRYRGLYREVSRGGTTIEDR